MAEAARLKLKRKPEAALAPVPEAKKPALEPEPAATAFREGETVEGNFKGFGDWDEALVAAVLPDGTYVLEYTDEGLIEEGVPPDRVRPFSDAAAPAGAGAPADAGASLRQGQTVLGNFKGLGDWDEALIIGKLPDGTYVLEYTDEGLIEEGVPADCIIASGGAGALESAEEVATLGAAAPALQQQREFQQEEESQQQQQQQQQSEEEDSEDSEDEYDPSSEPQDFLRASGWRGARPGYAFRAGASGVGYYKDVPLHIAAEQAERDAMVLTAPQLANWALEQLALPPSLAKADRYFSLFDLPNLRVRSLGKSGSAPPPLFGSLAEWFGRTLPVLSKRVAPAAVEVTHRVFLAPQQSVRQGIAHTTFSIDWLRVVGCDDEPISSAVLRRLNLAAKRPARMLLVVMYKAERNRITEMWADVDREGLGTKKGASLDDVLLSDAFDRCLALARRSGAVGELEPLFHNYFETQTIGA